MRTSATRTKNRRTAGLFPATALPDGRPERSPTGLTATLRLLHRQIHAGPGYPANPPVGAWRLPDSGPFRADSATRTRPGRHDTALSRICASADSADPDPAAHPGDPASPGSPEVGGMPAADSAAPEQQASEGGEVAPCATGTRPRGRAPPLRETDRTAVRRTPGPPVARAFAPTPGRRLPRSAMTFTPGRVAWAPVRKNSSRSGVGGRRSDRGPRPRDRAFGGPPTAPLSAIGRLCSPPASWRTPCRRGSGTAASPTRSTTRRG